MLPWMKDNKKSVAGLIMAKRKPEGGFAEGGEVEESQENYGLTACAEDFLKAVEAKDAKACAKAFQDMFDICESQPHEEYPHDENEDTE